MTQDLFDDALLSGWNSGFMQKREFLTNLLCMNFALWIIPTFRQLIFDVVLFRVMHQGVSFAAVASALNEGCCWCMYGCYLSPFADKPKYYLELH